MMYCPLMSYAKQYSNEQECLGKECAFAADKAGNCLVKQALQCYVDSAKEKTEFVRTYIGKPYQFLEPGDTSPAKLRHGGVYDDLSQLRDAHATPSTEVDFGPPRLDGSYIFSKGV